MNLQQVRAMGAGGHALDLSGAADFLSTGAVEVPIFEKEIFDIVRRMSPVLPRFQRVPATGHPHRYFEQTAVMTAAAADPRALSPSATGPTRVERSVMIKAVLGQSNLSLFDKDVTEQQGLFSSVVAKDIEDIVSGIQIKQANMLWSGSDTSLTTPTTFEWVGLLTQITQTSSVAPGSSIIDGLKTQVATMVANVTYVVRPNAIYVNPLLANFIDQEAKATHIELGTMDIAAGVTVKYISTQAGNLPLIPDPYMPTDATGQFGFAAPPAGHKNYFAVITMDSEIEIPVVSGASFNPQPRIFQLGLVGNLAGQFVGVCFDAIFAKGPSYAHAICAIQRI